MSTIPGKPLPQSLPARFRADMDTIDAYNVCLRYERQLVGNTRHSVAQHDRYRENLMHCRLVGYALIHCPTETGRRTMIDDINLCPGLPAFLNIGHIYAKFFVRIFRPDKGRIPEPPPRHPSDSFEQLRTTIYDQLRPSSRENRSVRKKALIRDRNKCAITGRFDTDYVKNNPASRQTVPREIRKHMGDVTVYTACAHIIPVSVNENIDSATKRRIYASTFWTVVHRLGFPDLRGKLNGTRINRLYNVITMRDFYHEEYDAMRLWFDPGDRANHYRVIIHPDVSYEPNDIPGDRYVTFRTDNPQTHALPCPDALKVHAFCCQLASSVGITKFDTQF